ncbi:MAG: EcsC family protein, partial [Microcoleus sp. SIO2G3]|nr:EcsC family protein [Microcoleus sp. SIO2G3]
ACSGLVSSLVPGAALALLAIDLAATTALQTEMIYQIAAVYGLDLQDPARKGEVLAIFGLALGGSKALQAGLGFLRNVPLAGAMIGAGTNATMIYTLGYAACRFYEAKQDGDLSETTLTRLQQESDRDLQRAIDQQQIVDQILARMLLASYPNKTWREIQPELERLQLSDRSVDTIAASLRSPQPLDQLLDRLDAEFAAPLYAQCQRVTQMNRDVSTAEQEILTAIAQRFELETRSAS